MRKRIFSLVWAMAAFLSAPALAQNWGFQTWVHATQASSNPFSALVGRERVAQEDRSKSVEIFRYIVASDDRSFLVEQNGDEARIQFLCGPIGDDRLDCALDPENPSPEIYMLRAARGPRGDTIFKDTEGDTVLRLAAYGGATVHWPGEPNGLGASKSFSDNTSLRLSPTDYLTALRRASAASTVLGEVIGAEINFAIDTPQYGDGDHSVLADAILMTAKGVQAVARDGLGARAIADRLTHIRFEAGNTVDLALDNDTLIVRYAPNRDVAGRPSSHKVSRFLEASL